MNKDLISRQDVIKEVSKYVHSVDMIIGNGTLSMAGCMDVAEEILEVLPSMESEPKWIPCDERLPEVGQCVLCYLKGWHYMGKYRVCKYRDADKYVNHPYFDFNEDGFPKVLAWMPLPARYKGGDSE